MRCSQLSMINSSLCSLTWAQSVCSIGLPASSRTPRTCAATFATSEASLIGARSTNQTPSGYFSSTSAPICNDRRVLPKPPMPRSVRRRVVSSRRFRLGEFAFATDERGHLLRQVVGCRFERAQRRKILSQLRMHELVHPLGCRQITQPDCAEIPQGDLSPAAGSPTRSTTACEISICPPCAAFMMRAARLTGLPKRSSSRRSTTPRCRPARTLSANAFGRRQPLQRLLQNHRGIERVYRVVEGGVHAVASHLDDDAAVTPRRQPETRHRGLRARATSPPRPAPTGGCFPQYP